MKRLLALMIALAAASAAPALAQTAGAPPANAADLTCGDLMRGLRVADPGKSPTPERRRAAEEAQDDIAMGLSWIHGYRTAKQGSAMPPLDPAWMERQLRSVVTSCRARSPDGMLTLLSVIEP